MAGWLARAGCGPAGVRLERETHPLLLQVSNQHFSVLAALRCACPAPPSPHDCDIIDSVLQKMFAETMARARGQSTATGCEYSVHVCLCCDSFGRAGEEHGLASGVRLQ